MIYEYQIIDYWIWHTEICLKWFATTWYLKRTYLTHLPDLRLDNRLNLYSSYIVWTHPNWPQIKWNEKYLRDYLLFHVIVYLIMAIICIKSRANLHLEPKYRINQLNYISPIKRIFCFTKSTNTFYFILWITALNSAEKI